MNIKKIHILSLYIAASLTLAACDSTTNSSSTPIAVSSPPPEVINVSGKAAKGLILGGIVNIHPIINGALSDALTTTSSTTSPTDGSYSIDIPDYDGNPFIVRVSTADDGSTSMRCDLAGGCGGGVAFGGTVTLDDPDFNLDAIMPSITDPTTSVNLSVLTDTATSVALDTLASNSDITLEETMAAISNANSSVANRFGLQGDITTLPIVDLTDPFAVAAASNNILTFNLFSASIVEAMIGGDPTLSIAEAVRDFSAQFVNDGGLADTETSTNTSVTLAEILSQASAIIDAIQAADTDGLTNLATLESIIDTNQSLAENGSTDPDPGTPTDPTLSDLDKAQAMVQSLRELQAITFTDTEAFAERVELASNSLDNDAGDVMQALIYAAEAIGSASNAHSDDDTITTFTDSDTNITVAIVTTNTDTTYDVDTTINVGSTPVAVTVDITAIDKNSNTFLDEADGTNETSTAFTVGLDIQGTASSDYAELDITSGIVTVMAAIIEETLTDSDTETVDADITDLTLDLNVSLSEVDSATTPDPITFTGNILLSIDNVVVDSSKTGTYIMGDDGPANFLETWDESITFDEVTFFLAGEFEAPSGASLSASVRMAADGTDFTYACSNTSGIPGDETCSSDSDLVDITLNATTKVDVSGISTEEGIRLSVIQSRTDAQNDDPLIIMSYDETLLTIMPSEEENTNGTSELTLIVTDQNNVTMTMVQTETANESVINGNITVNGVEQATLGDDQGTIIITYTDGFNESF